MKPRYIHDCKECKFLGSIDRYDLYVCTTPTDLTGIARFGNDGPEYSSRGFLEGHIRSVKMEIGGISDDEAAVLAIFRSMPSLLLNALRKNSYQNFEDEKGELNEQN